jgi:hypothetical protein
VALNFSCCNFVKRKKKIGRVEQAFRPAVKLSRGAASAAEVVRENDLCYFHELVAKEQKQAVELHHPTRRYLSG